MVPTSIRRFAGTSIADGAGEGQHGVFILGHGGKAGRGQLDDPRSAHAAQAGLTYFFNPSR